MKISVSGKQFAFPRSCACCGAYSVTTLPVSGAERNKKSITKAWVFDVPYCKACKTHIQRSEGLAILTLSLASIAIIAAFLLGLKDWVLGLESFGLLITLTALLGLALYALLRSTRLVNCTGLTRAVTYLGSNGPCHTFEMRSRFYASDFVLLNHRKLVNVSTEVAGILRNTRFGNYQVPRRIVDRRR